MAKTRMNNGHRTVFKEFALKKVEEAIDRKQEHKLYKQILAGSNKVIRKKYPEEHMEIIRKYNLKSDDHHIKFVFPSGRVDGFTSAELVDIPYSRSYGSRQDVYQMTAEFEVMLDEYELIKKKNDELLRQKQRDCNSLIEFAKYIEDVLEVIKVPPQIEAKLLAKSTALVALSPDVIARIQADFSA